jgi:hypothetical protein
MAMNLRLDIPTTVIALPQLDRRIGPGDPGRIARMKRARKDHC